MTGGDIRIEAFPINAIVDRKAALEAILAGVLSGDLASVAYFSGRNRAFAIMGDIIAGYDAPEQIQTFCRHRGGRDALQELWDTTLPGAFHVVGCGPVSKEALVSKVPIRGVADLDDLKIRSPSGLAATVFKAAGAAAASIPFTDVFTPLEKGVIDAADASAYVNNDANGFHQVAKYPLCPGIHSMAIHQFTIYQAQWDSFIEAQQLVLETWYYAAYDELRRQLDLHDNALASRDTAGGEIEVINWSLDERNKFREIATRAWEATADKSPEARAALDAHYGCMRAAGPLKKD